MKILHIVESLDNRYGGPAKSVPLLVKYLNKLNIKNKVFSVQAYKDEENSLLDESGIDVTKVPLMGLYKIKYSPTLEYKIIQEIREDTVIHVHTAWTYPTYIGYKIAKKYNVPLVLSVRGTMYEWALNQSKYIKKFAMFIFQKDMLNYADFLHITEPNERKSLEAINIKNKTILIPNGIELDHMFYSLNKGILSKINYDTNIKYIMFLGRIVHNKGLHYLINSYIKLKNKYKNIEVLVVGGVEDKKYFKKIIKPDGVHFLGVLDGEDKHTVFCISSLFVLPTKSENFGISIAEAMSYKIPVVTTTGTPWQEIEKNNAGWWVDLSQENIDNAIDEAMGESYDMLKAKGDRGYDIIKHYTWDRQALKMKKCYKEIFNKGSGE
jgi:glycosyltransferase involved in cell wall biosynthesis